MKSSSGNSESEALHLGHNINSAKERPENIKLSTLL